MATNKKNQRNQRKKTTNETKNQLAERNIEKNNLKIISYEITYEPIKGMDFEDLSEEIQDQLHDMHSVIMNPDSEPQEFQQMIEKLLVIIQQYPDTPIIYNFLYNAYKLLGDTENSKRVIQETLEKFPNYLFARISYADECISNGDLEQIPVIFENKFDLSLLYPERKVFHISELINFSGIMARYFYEKNDIQKAKIYYKIMKQADPKENYPVTESIRKMLKQTLLDKIIGNFINHSAN